MQSTLVKVRDELRFVLNNLDYAIAQIMRKHDDPWGDANSGRSIFVARCSYR